MKSKKPLFLANLSTETRSALGPALASSAGHSCKTHFDPPNRLKTVGFTVRSIQQVQQATDRVVNHFSLRCQIQQHGSSLPLVYHSVRI